MRKRYYLGIDVGSVSLDVVVIDHRKRTAWWTYRRVHGDPHGTLSRVLGELFTSFMEPRNIKEFENAVATGSGKEIVCDLLGISSANEIVAHGTAASSLVKGKASVIEIGGQDSKFILVDEKGPYDYSMNELCAAGTGAFLDVQSERLGMSIEELSEKASRAKNIPSVAGRCSVFAKSDIIHLQQRGVVEDEIVSGLCYALARNYIATMIRGREIVKPVVFQGGVALNKGVLRAFRELLKIQEKDIVIPSKPQIMGAVGAGLLARDWKNQALTHNKIRKAINSIKSDNLEKIALKAWEMTRLTDKQRRSMEKFEFNYRAEISGNCFLGIDVGSVSTDAILIDNKNEIIAKVYVFTEGKPIKAVERALKFLQNNIEQKDIISLGVTGSGRKLVGSITGSDIIIDEITAQAKGAFHFFSDADTIIEIGGQDAKFIKLDTKGLVEDFEMNRACSAGTGSFIQEQAVRLGVDLKKDFARLALSSEESAPMASRCSVFMESDIVHHLQRKTPLEDILMSISTAVVENYITRVAQGREMGNRVIFQGGVAKNSAVVESFKRRLFGSEISVHPEPETSGALGVALLAKEMSEIPAAGNSEKSTFKGSRFKGFDMPASSDVGILNCRGCENSCEVNVFKISREKYYFGDLCGRYSERLNKDNMGSDHSQVKDSIINKLKRFNERKIEKIKNRKRKRIIGIPESLLFREYFPFWFAFFEDLNIDILTSGLTDSEKFQSGLKRLPAETCLPVKVMFGHVNNLKSRGIKRVFIPSPTDLEGRSVCPYIQHASSMIASSFPEIEVMVFPLVPELDSIQLGKLCSEIEKNLGIEKETVDKAYKSAMDMHLRTIRTQKLDIPKERPQAVIMGKPYTIGDRFLNLALSTKLSRAGFDVMHYDQIKIPDNYSFTGKSNYSSDKDTWYFNSRMIHVADYISTKENLYPIVITNFGCGPDAFSLQLLEDILQNKLTLFIELDEHRADAGLETRVEAFAQCVIQRKRMQKEGISGYQKGEKTPLDGAIGSKECEYSKTYNTYSDSKLDPVEGLKKGKKRFIIPRFADHAFAFAGILKSKGHEVDVLPLPDREIMELGMEITGGKQCHPFHLITGDIVKLLKDDSLPLNSIYMFPITTCSSCLISQYIPTIRRYLQKMGRGDIEVVGTSPSYLLDMLGMKKMVSLGRGILGIDYILRLKHELRPYEIIKSSVNRSYDRGLIKIVKGISQERTHRGIAKAIEIMDNIAVDKKKQRPIIGVAGDVYTRINPVGNSNLFDVLEELGCEVWISPTIFDVSLVGTELGQKRYWRQKEYREMAYSWASVKMQKLEMWRVQKYFKGILKNISEPDGEVVEKYIKGLLPDDPELLIALNVAKHLDFAEKGVDGILNVFCLNCMIGTSTAALFPAIKERTGNIPMMSLVYDGLGSTHSRNRIEAFVHRAKRHFHERSDGFDKEEGIDQVIRDNINTFIDKVKKKYISSGGK